MARTDRSSALTWMFVAACVACFAWFILATNDFNNDDLDNFVVMRDGDLLRLMFSPLHGHWSPFHRFSSWLVYAVAPMRFEASLLVLIAFHLGTLAYLYATLRQFGLDLSARVIVCAYACCGLLLYGMIWWANAQLRVPHAMLCAAAIFHYLVWLKGGGRRHAVLSAAAFLLDLCVFQKAVLIPVYMLVVGFLAVPGRFRRGMAEAVRAAALPSVLLAIAIAFVIVYMMMLPPQMRPGIALTLSVEWTVIKAFMAALLGVTAYQVENVEGPTHVALLWVAGAFWLSMLLLSLRLAPRVWLVWVGMLFVVALDFLPLTTSNRTFFGLLSAYSYRYHFETVYLVAIFCGLICAGVTAAWRERGKSLRSPALAIAIVAAYAGTNLVAVAMARAGSLEFDISRQAHAYMGNLREGLGGIGEPAPVFRDSSVPWYMSILVGPDWTRQIVPLFIPDARFDPAAQEYYLVLEDGKVVKKVPAR